MGLNREEVKTMQKCKCTKSGHYHDGLTCDMPINDIDKVCFRCGATTNKRTSEDDTDDMELGY